MSATSKRSDDAPRVVGCSERMGGEAVIDNWRPAIQENPSHGLNVPYFGAKWIFYTYVQAATLFVAIPILATAVIAALVALVRQRRPKSLWAVYRAGSALVAVWMVLGLYGLWYIGAHPT